MVAFLTRPVSHYEQRGFGRIDLLRRHVRKGDVLLVDGDQRVSAIIKTLTQSCWSHAALYIGDELLQRGGEVRAWAEETWGDEAGELLVEALMDGVVASPLSKYTDYNVRLCRPHRLRPEDAKTILNEAVAAIGWRYDLRNIVDLSRHLLLTSLSPRWRRMEALRLGSGADSAVICTSLLGRLFEQVGFPVLPDVRPPEDAVRLPKEPRWRMGLVSLLRRRRPPPGIFLRRHPTLLTPRDFDLSPYFEVVKLEIADGGFDYQGILWEDPDPSAMYSERSGSGSD